MEVAWSRQAADDLVEVRAYIGERNRTAAEHVAARILEAVEHLRAHPALGRPGRVPGTRELVVTSTPFLIPYRVRDDTVELLRVLHGARRWPKRF